MRLFTHLRSMLLVLLMALGPMEAAWAHAQLLSSTPEENALVETAPQQVQLRFNEPVTPLAVRLIGPDGEAVGLTAASAGGEMVAVTLPAALAQGTQALSWRVVSTDGHPIGGTLIFSIGAVTGATPLEQTGDNAVAVSLWLGKAMLFVCLFGGVGGALFAATAALPEDVRRVVAALNIGGLVLVALTLGLQGLDALGLSFSGFFETSTWGTGLGTSYGATAIALGLAFTLALTGTLAASRATSPFDCLAALAAAAALSLSGHASAAQPQWLTRPAVFLHIASLLYWLGALLPLASLLREPSANGDQALARFSRVIPLAVAPLLLSGLVLAVVQMGAPGPAWLTPYGYLLAAKLALLVALFGLTLWNRFGLTAPALRGAEAARRQLRRSILVEMALAVVIVGLVAGWRFTPPPRALAEVANIAAAEPTTEHLIAGDTMVMLTMTPGKAGPVSLELFIGDLAHLPKEAQAVSLILSAPELGIEPIRREAIAAEGIWRVEGLTIPLPGTWTAEVEVRLSRFELVRPRAEIIVP